MVIHVESPETARDQPTLRSIIGLAQLSASKLGGYWIPRSRGRQLRRGATHPSLAPRRHEAREAHSFLKVQRTTHQM